MNTKVLGNGDTLADQKEHFTDSQDKGHGFRNVSKVWTEQCITFQQGRELLADQQQAITDIRCGLDGWATDVVDGQFVMVHKASGNAYRPTSHAIKNIAYVGKGSSWQLADLLEPKVHTSSKDKRTGEPKVLFERDERDAELLCNIVDHYLFNADRLEQDKIRLFRTWSDGTLRAVLSDQYSIVNNDWYMSVLEEAIPGGLLSHWRGDADTIFGNVLIPDSIRQEDDSAYGGMLSVGNSEIGLRRIMSLPSVFRAICMNGCIWDQENGKGCNKVHRGEINLEQLKFEIIEGLQKQIPLLSSGIDRLLLTKQLKIGITPLKNILAVICKENGITKRRVPALAKAFKVEENILGSEVRTAFGVVSTITRFGQELENDGWVKMDMVGGELSNIDSPSWENLLKRAGGLSDKQVEKILGDISHLLG